METLRLGLDAFNRRDKAAFVAICDSQVENVPPKEWPENAPIQGAEARSAIDARVYRNGR